MTQRPAQYLRKNCAKTGCAVLLPPKGELRNCAPYETYARTAQDLRKVRLTIAAGSALMLRTHHLRRDRFRPAETAQQSRLPHRTTDAAAREAS